MNMNIANEPPSALLMVDRTATYKWKDGTYGNEYDIGPYQACVRFDWLGNEGGKSGRAMIQVARADGGSVVDWRDLQQIKNLVVGPEWEAVEIYPAESRLKDPSNARYLWAFQGQAPFGLPGGRVVKDAHEAFAPQRPLPVSVAEGGAA